LFIGGKMSGNVAKMEFQEIQAKGLEEAAKVERCHYLKPSGERCGSPAMTGHDLCYYHDRYQPKAEYRNLPCLEDPHSVQCAIQEVIEDMLRGFLDYKKAALALYGLQTAASNLKQMRIADEQRRKREEQEEARTVDRAPSTDDSREATDGFSPARSAGLAVVLEGESRRDDWRDDEDDHDNLQLESAGAARLQPSRTAEVEGSALATEVRVPLDEDDLEEIELTADSLLPTTNDHRPTTLIESPRPPQRITQGLLTKTEREARDNYLPDLEKLRAEILRDAGREERGLASA
jgi:hypothetical protein